MPGEVTLCWRVQEVCPHGIDQFWRVDVCSAARPGVGRGREASTLELERNVPGIGQVVALAILRPEQPV